jgi:hypothetical protein
MTNFFWIIIEVIFFGLCGLLLSSIIDWVFQISTIFSYFLGYSLTYILNLFRISKIIKKSNL